jgi:DNA invertase Pin-like site-specific DNA recombinase
MRSFAGGVLAMSRVIGYLRVSTEEQDLEKFKAEILIYANRLRLGNVDWVEEKISGTVPWQKRQLGAILTQLKSGDVIIVNEISRLARSLLQIIEIIEYCRTNGIEVHALKGGWVLKGNTEDIGTKVTLFTMAMISEVERDLISLRTTEALAARKAAGVRLGRKKGPGKSRLDAFRPEIIALLKNGSAKTFVAQRYNVDPATLYNWLAKNQIDTTPRFERVTA